MANLENEGEYSRDAYEKAESSIDAVNQKISPEKSTDELRTTVEEKAQVEKRRGGLYEMAWDEALELNKKYDEYYSRLELKQDEVDQIKEEIATFRREKLDMGEQKIEAQERTSGTEIQRNIKEWKVRARILELGMDDATIEAEVRAAIEAVSKEEAKELGREVAYEVMLKGVSPSQILKLAKEHSRYIELDSMDEYFDTQKLPRDNKEKSYAIAYAFQQEPDPGGLGENAKSAEDWEKTGDEYMDLPERVLAGMSWKQEKSSELDEKNVTLAAGSRSRYGYVSYMYFSPGYREVNVNDSYPRYRYPILGPRRVVSSES